MNIDHRLRKVTHLSAVFAMLALGVAEMNPLYLGLILVVAVVGWPRITPRRQAASKSNALNVVVLLALAYAVVEYTMLSREWIRSVAHWLLFIQMAKLLLPKTDRDYAQIFVISLMNVAVAAILTVSPLFALMFILYSGTVMAAAQSSVHARQRLQISSWARVISSV